MEEIKENDVVVSLSNQRTNSSQCEIKKGYINKAHNVGGPLIWFNETTSGAGAYHINNFRLATKEECKLFKEKGAHVLNQEYKIGDYVVCIGDVNKSKSFLSSSGWNKNLCFEVIKITNTDKGTQILWGGIDGCGVYEDQVRLATAEEKAKQPKKGENYYVYIKYGITQKSYEYKAGDWVMMTEDYVGEHVKKGCIYRLIRKQSEDSKCWIVDHQGANSFLAPFERMFRLAKPHEIHPDNSLSSLPELVKVVGIVNNVPHQEPKILRKNKKKRKLVIVNQ